MLRAQGLDWSAAQIASLESGRRNDLEVGELLKLSLAIEVSVASWYRGAGHTMLDKPGAAPVTRADLQAVRALLQGKAPDDAISKENDDSVSTGFETTFAGVDAKNQAASAMHAFLVGRPVPSGAEIHAAKRLGVDPVALYQAAEGLWTHGLDEERERLLAEKPETSAGSAPAYRGHVTRQLLGQLRGALTSSNIKTTKATTRRKKR
jgi:hypothetical protein